MTKKSFGGEDFGLGIGVPETVEQPPINQKSAPSKKVVIQSSKPKNKPISNKRKYKRNDFAGSESKVTGFKVNEANAQAFKVLCAVQKTSASAVINDFISRYLKENQ